MKKILTLTIIFLLLLSTFSIFTPQVKAETSTGLYAGGTNPGVVYEYKGGTTWSAISSSLGWSVTSLITYEGKLFAAVITNPDIYSSIGKVYRYDGVPEWTPVGTLDNQVTFLIVYKGELYAGTATPAKLYKYNPATGSWSKVKLWEEPWETPWFGFRSAYVYGDRLYLGEWYWDYFARWDGITFQKFYSPYSGSCIYSFEEYKGVLYAGAYVGRIYKVTPEPKATAIWGPESNYRYAWSLKSFKDYLYIGFDANGTLVAPLYRYDGTSFTQVWSYSTTTTNYHEGIISMTTDGTYLYVGVGGQAVGYPEYMSGAGTGKVYRSSDGINFEPASGIMGSGVQTLYYVGKFKRGDIVRAIADLRVRNDKGEDTGVVVPKGYIGIIQGPSKIFKIGSIEYIFWEIVWTNKINRDPLVPEIKGWCAEDWLLNVMDDIGWLSTVIASEASSIYDQYLEREVVFSSEERSGVGWCVLNRLYTNIYGPTSVPTTIEQVIFPLDKRWAPQFAYGDIPTSEIRELARRLLEKRIPDLTAGATHFFSPISAPKEGEPIPKKADVKGGLHYVPLPSHIPVRIYFPGWAAKSHVRDKCEGWGDVCESDTHKWTGNLEGVRNAYFMFYRQVMPKIKVRIESPAELRIYDYEGRVTGVIEGKIVKEIPGSEYYDNTITIFFPFGSYLYEVAGTGEELYGLMVTAVILQGDITFAAINIPTLANAVHQYTVDWATLFRGEEGVTVQIDSDGDGIFEHFITSDSEFTHDEFMLQTATVIDFDPDTLDLKSNGTWVTVYIELPEGYNLSQIDVSSVMLNGAVPALAQPTEIGDYDGDGIPDLMVKFDRAYVIAFFAGKALPGNYVTEVTGTWAGILFKGKDTIKIISPP